MQIDDMRKAVNEAKCTLETADRVAATMGDLLVGRLRHCDNWTLRRLKRELRAYNPHTKTWRT